MRIRPLHVQDQFILDLVLGRRERVMTMLGSGSLDWKYIVDTSVKNKIKTLIARTLSRYELPADERRGISAFIKYTLIEADLSRKIYMEELMRINAAFANAGIELILLKGLSIPGDRDIGDLDLLITDQNLVRAARILDELGYEYTRETNNITVPSAHLERPELQLSWNSHFGYYNSQKKLLVELHTNLFERRRVYAENLDPILDKIGMIWKDSIVDTTLDCRVLSPEDQLILACLHFTIKRAPQQNRFTLGLAIDIQNIIHSINDFKKLLEKSSRYRTDVYTAFAIEFTSKLFNLDSCKVIYRELYRRLSRSEQFIKRVHARCFNTFVKSKQIYVSLYRYVLPFILGNEIKYIAMSLTFSFILFPLRSRIRTEFRINKGSQFLILIYLFRPFLLLHSKLKRLLGIKK